VTPTSTEDDKSYYATLGLPPDATFAQVKARYKELNDAYLKILERSRKDESVSKHSEAGGRVEPVQSSPPQATHTEPMASLREKLAQGKIDKAKFESLARARYAYLHNKPFADLTDEEFNERLSGFEKLKIKF